MRNFSWEIIDIVLLSIMARRLLGWFLITGIAVFGDGIPTPEEHLGFRPGDDFKLADYNDIFAYYKKVSKARDRIRLRLCAITPEGQPMLFAAFSSADNLK